jgi:hypothetical protein
MPILDREEPHTRLMHVDVDTSHLDTCATGNPLACTVGALQPPLEPHCNPIWGVLVEARCFLRGMSPNSVLRVMCALGYAWQILFVRPYLTPFLKCLKCTAILLCGVRCVNHWVL